MRVLHDYPKGISINVAPQSKYIGFQLDVDKPDRWGEYRWDLVLYSYNDPPDAVVSHKLAPHWYLKNQADAILFDQAN